MAFEYTRKDSYYKNSKNCGEHELPCIICGKPIKNEKTARCVIVGGGGGCLLTPEEYDEDVKDEARTGLIGPLPVGSDCWRKNPEMHSYELVDDYIKTAYNLK